MAKEVMIVTPDEIKNLPISEVSLNYYQLLLAHAGLEMDEGALADFIAHRNGNKSGRLGLWELKAWCEKTAASIKEVMKHAFNVGTSEELPADVKWSKQSYTYEFAEGAGAIIANALISKKLVTKDQLFNMLTVSNIAKAAGLTTDKLIDMYPDCILAKEKERTLSIK